MPRYIDADKLWNDRPLIPEGKSQDYGAGFSECMWGFSRNIRKQIDTESADVVPKSEVERLEREKAEMLVSKETDVLISMEKLVKVRTEHPIFKAIEEKVAREIFEEIEKIATSEGAYDYVSIQEIAELKKKYTEKD